MLRRIDSRELTEWMAFERTSGPLGPARLDLHAAMICQMIANANRDPKTQPIGIEKFLPDWDAPKEVDLGDDP